MSGVGFDDANSLQQTQIGDYRIGDLIGEGAYGKVYQALNVNMGITVAIKRVYIGKMDTEDLKGLEMEIKLLEQLQHPNIVQYIDTLIKKNYLHIVMEYAENSSLSANSKKFGSFPEPLVAVYIQQVIQGLCYLHERNVIHRDIKGANILSTKSGRVKLTDFGVATKLRSLADGEEINKDEQDVVGTPYWMAPEIIQMQQTATPACDIWSVGCTVIELLTGNPPYYDLDPMPALYRIVEDPHPPLPQGITNELRDFLLKCFEKDPKKRIDAIGLMKHRWLSNSSTTIGDENKNDMETLKRKRKLMGTYKPTMKPSSGIRKQAQMNLAESEAREIRDSKSRRSDAGRRSPRRSSTSRPSSRSRSRGSSRKLTRKIKQDADMAAAPSLPNTLQWTIILISIYWNFLILIVYSMASDRSVSGAGDFGKSIFQWLQSGAPILLMTGIACGLVQFDRRLTADLYGEEQEEGITGIIKRLRWSDLIRWLFVLIVTLISLPWIFSIHLTYIGDLTTESLTAWGTMGGYMGCYEGGTLNCTNNSTTAKGPGGELSCQPGYEAYCPLNMMCIGGEVRCEEWNIRSFGGCYGGSTACRNGYGMCTNGSAVCEDAFWLGEGASLEDERVLLCNTVYGGMAYCTDPGSVGICYGESACFDDGLRFNGIVSCGRGYCKGGYAKCDRLIRCMKIDESAGETFFNLKFYIFIFLLVISSFFI